jgi:hypothetical protein
MADKINAPGGQEVEVPSVASLIANLEAQQLKFGADVGYVFATSDLLPENSSFIPLDSTNLNQEIRVLVRLGARPVGLLTTEYLEDDLVRVTSHVIDFLGDHPGVQAVTDYARDRVIALYEEMDVEAGRALRDRARRRRAAEGQE